MKSLINRIWKNWTTTLIGVVLGGFMGYLLYTGKITFENFCYILPTVLLLLGVKDTIVGINRDKKDGPDTI